MSDEAERKECYETYWCCEAFDCTCWDTCKRESRETVISESIYDSHFRLMRKVRTLNGVNESWFWSIW